MLNKQTKQKFRFKSAHYLLSILILCLIGYITPAQNIQICAGDDVTLEGWSNEINCCHIPGIPTAPVDCFDLLQPGGNWVDDEGNIVCENCVDFTVSPTRTTTYFHRTPEHHCPPPKPGIGDIGPQPPSPDSYPAGPIIQIEVIVENCDDQDLFKAFPWLSSVINSTTCQIGDNVALYNYGRYEYIIVETNNRRTMYADDGTRYCRDRNNFSCVEIYDLEGPNKVWNCGIEPPTEIEATFSNLVCNNDGTFSIDVTATGARSGTYGIYGTVDDLPPAFTFEEGETFTLSGGIGNAVDNLYTLYIYDFYLADVSASPFEVNIEACMDNSGNPSLFNQYTWLTSLIDPENCQSNDKVELYTSGRYDYLIVETNNQRTMYADDGTRYCRDRENRSCAEIYELEGPISVWVCNSEVDPCVPAIQPCFVEDPLSLGFIQSTIATGNTQTGCFVPYKITQIDYNGSSYFRTSVGPKPNDMICGVQEYFGDIRNCEGTIICVFALAAPPECFNEEVCSGIQSGRATETVIWQAEGVIQNPPIFDKYSWLKSIVNPSDCDEYTSIREYNLGRYAYVFIETQSGGVLYFEDGTKYCTNRNSRDCEMLYELTDPTSTYNCGGDTNDEYDYVYTICPGESVTLTANYDIIYEDCTCEPCTYDGAPGPQNIEWSPSNPNCSGCRSQTVSPTETTTYTSFADNIVYWPDCAAQGAAGIPTKTTFLVIVEEENCENKSCEYTDPLTDLEWLVELANEDIPQRISTHNYNDEIVFLRSIELIDAGYEIFNCEGEIICNVQIFYTDNNCPDFNFNETLVEFIFDNSCNAQEPLQLAWIQEIINQRPEDDCATHSIETFEYANKRYFILKPGVDCNLSTTGGGFSILNCERGTVCTTVGSVTCNDAILEAAQDAVEIWSYQPLVDNPIFDKYSWLNEIIDPSNCDEYITIREYDLGRYAYIFIETQNGGVLYIEDGTRYCRSSNSRDCEMLYELTNPTSTYNCDDDNVEYDYVYTICSGDEIELVPKWEIEYIECICEPCGQEGHPGEPDDVEWSSTGETCNSCFRNTVSPTETTEYTAFVEKTIVGSTGCDDEPDETDGPDGDGLRISSSTKTTFLVIVEDEACEEIVTCEYTDPLTDLEWLADLSNIDVPQKISIHNYNDGTVFIRSIEAVDGGYDVYNCQGEIICSANIFNTTDNCPDFSFSETLEEIIFDNTCEAQNPLQLDWVKEIINTKPEDNCSTHSIEMFEYAGRKHFILKPSSNCTLSTPGGGFSILNCNNETVCTTVENVTCNDAILEAAQNTNEIWVYDEREAQRYDYVYTICPGDLIELIPEYKINIIECICEPCGREGHPGPPENVEWAPVEEACTNCFSNTVSPTETTAYTALAETADVGDTGCGPGYGPDGRDPSYTKTTFLVKVDQTCGNPSKKASNDQVNFRIAPQIKIYPNPTTDIINIVLPQTENIRNTLTLKNTNGQILKHLQLQSNTSGLQQIDLSDYATSLYLLEYFNGENITVKKIIKR